MEHAEINGCNPRCVRGIMKNRMVLWKLCKKSSLVGLVVALPLVTPTEATAQPTTEEAQAPPHHEADSEPVVGKKKETSQPKGLFKPIQIGEGITLQFGGFAKVDYMQDFDPIGNADQFKVNSIPVDGDPDAGLGGSNNISARQTRLSFDIRADESAGYQEREIVNTIRKEKQS